MDALTLLADTDVPPELDGAVVELTRLDRRAITAEIRIPGHQREGYD
jgi:hypothetical protein